jgi:DNA polymerase-4
VALKLRTSKFKILTRSHAPNIAPSSCREVMAIALELRERVGLEPQQRYRLGWHRLEQLSRTRRLPPAQPLLFE